jgi:hypothetical protein
MKHQKTKRSAKTRNVAQGVNIQKKRQAKKLNYDLADFAIDIATGGTYRVAKILFS